MKRLSKPTTLLANLGRVVEGRGPVRHLPIPAVTTRPTVEERIREHSRVLAAVGVENLGTLGTLKIGGVVVPQPGVLTPAIRRKAERRVSPDTTTPIRSARAPARFAPGGESVGGRGDSVRTMQRVGGIAEVLTCEAFPARVDELGRVVAEKSPERGPGPAPAPRPYPAPTTLPLQTAYWAASSITIEDGTVIVLRPPNRYLVIIADAISIGDNVTLTWERRDRTPPTAPEPPGRPPAAPQSTTTYAGWGEPGSPGSPGKPGRDGDPGPEIEVWTLQMTGAPVVDVGGEDGVDGGAGGDGGPGGNGPKGRDCIVENPYGGVTFVPVQCPGNGGYGGPGGNGGAGGAGGRGGHGGRFTLYAPQDAIDAFAMGLAVDITGGAGGRGGDGGAGGPGGAKGTRGAACPAYMLGGCDDYTPHDGTRGVDGQPGAAGDDGAPGSAHADGVSMAPIDESDFRTKFGKPSLETLSASVVSVGETVWVSGKRFATSDKMLAAGRECDTNVASDTLLSFIVPNVEGGYQPIVLRQQDGTLSNRHTLLVRPTIAYLEQNGRKSTDTPQPRFMPGDRITLVGTGFASDLSILLLDEPAAGEDIAFLDSNTVEFTLIRPTTTPAAATPGEPEPIEIRVALPVGETSNPLSVLLDTYVMLVVGDSIAWGQGLREDLKFHSSVESHIRQLHGDIGVYKTVAAHSGATIGARDRTEQPSLPGEVPTSRPTIIQQVDSYLETFTNDPQAADAVRLVLLDGGINDVKVKNILNPLLLVPTLPSLPDEPPPLPGGADLRRPIEEACHEDMVVLLEKVTQEAFRNATVVVTSYYQIVSELSEPAFLSTWLSFLPGLGWAIGSAVESEVRDELAARSEFFLTESNKQLERAVTEVNATLGSKRVYLAKPQLLTHRRAVFAPGSWLWGLDWDLAPADDPEFGGVAPEREIACDAAPSGRISEFECYRASVAHPNVRGAAEYARAITALGIL